MTVVERPAQVAWCLHHLRTVYPDIPVTVLSDGTGYPQYPAISSQYGARFLKGDRLKRASKGGQWWERTLSSAWETGADFVLKIDPDTKFQRPIQVWPETDIAGTLTGARQRFEHIQGGVQLFRRRAIERLLESKYFQREELYRSEYYAWGKDLLNHARRTDYLCTDAMLKKAKADMGLTWGPWSEVCSKWKSLPARHQHFAVTHPHKWQRFEVGGQDKGCADSENRE